MLTKTEAKKVMTGDYIPNGKPVDIQDLTFRRTLEFEVYRCGRQTGYDPQSGPIFCGDLAEWLAKVDNGVVCLCERHHK